MRSIWIGGGISRGSRGIFRLEIDGRKPRIRKGLLD